MNDTRTDEQFMLDTLCDGDPVVLVNVPRGVIRTLRAEIVQRDEEIARLLNIFHALDAPQKTLVEVTADRDSWERQASDRCDDVLVALDRAERAEAESADLRADLDACRSALRAASRAAEVTPPAAAPPTPAADLLP